MERIIDKISASSASKLRAQRFGEINASISKRAKYVRLTTSIMVRRNRRHPH